MSSFPVVMSPEGIHPCPSSLHSKRSIPTLSEPDSSKLILSDEVFIPELISPSIPTRALSILVSGGVVSRTITLKVSCPIFPDLSTDLHTTLVLPIGKVEPDAGEQRGINELSTLSVTITLYVI